MMRIMLSMAPPCFQYFGKLKFNVEEMADCAQRNIIFGFRPRSCSPKLVLSAFNFFELSYNSGEAQQAR